MISDSAPGNSQFALVSELLEAVADGRTSLAAAIARFTAEADPNTFATPEASVDLDRQRRCGFPEVVYGEGKSITALLGIVEALVTHGEPALVTRLSPDQAAALRNRFSAVILNETARTARIEPLEKPPAVGHVLVVTAGTSDRPVAEEAIETLHWMGCSVELIVDIGVAGPKRLLEQKHRFDSADAVIVIAGMEGALPSVVGGWVPCPVIAVPTSVGYGANFGGLAALLGMLNSCASNVCVVNIDAGFKGAYVAGMIARQTARGRQNQ